VPVSRQAYRNKEADQVSDSFDIEAFVWWVSMRLEQAGQLGPAYAEFVSSPDDVVHLSGDLPLYTLYRDCQGNWAIAVNRPMLCAQMAIFGWSDDAEREPAAINAVEAALTRALIAALHKIGEGKGICLLDVLASFEEAVEDGMRLQ
jgi:hypothetical protein